MLKDLEKAFLQELQLLLLLWQAQYMQSRKKSSNLKNKKRLSSKKTVKKQLADVYHTKLVHFKKAWIFPGFFFFQKTAIKLTAANKAIRL